MPQFDFLTIYPQLSCLLLTLYLFYNVNVEKFLIKYSTAKKCRNKKSSENNIKDELTKANKSNLFWLLNIYFNRLAKRKQ